MNLYIHIYLDNVYIILLRHVFQIEIIELNCFVTNPYCTK